MLKRTLSLILALLMCVLLLAACAPEAAEPAEAETAEEAPAAEAEEAPEAAADEEVYVIPCGTTVGANVGAENSAEVTAVESFKEYVEAASNGRIKVEIYYGNSLGSVNDVLAGCVAGTAGLFAGDIIVTKPFYELIQMFVLPAAFTSNEQANAFFDSEWCQDFFATMAEESGILPLAVNLKGYRHFTTVDGPLTSPEDLNGLTIRTNGDAMVGQIVTSLGGAPVPIDFADMYNSIQNGLVDGHENAIGNIIQDKTYELEKYLVMDAHTPCSCSLLMSKKIFDELPADLQQVVLDGAIVSRDRTRELQKKIDAEGLAFLRENGVEIYEPTAEELQEWQAIYREDCIAIANEMCGEENVSAFYAAVEAFNATYNN